MNKLVALVLLGLMSTAYAIEKPAVSIGFESDYIWQDRFKKAMRKALKGVAKAQYSVGEMLEKGRGTKKDMTAAYNWYQKAAQQRHLKAQYKLGYFHYKGLGVDQNLVKAFEHLQVPADKGNVRAQYYLGKLYASGHGVEKDPQKAMLWYSRASTGGYRPAENELELVKKSLADKKKKLKRSKKSKRPSAKVTHKKPKKAKKLPRTLAAVTKAIMNGGWFKGEHAAEFLPSENTHCKMTSDSIMECQSEKLKRSIGTDDIFYITRALLYDINKRGEFKVAYRNNVLKVLSNTEGNEDTDDSAIENETSLGSKIKTGWQETEHQLICKIKDNLSIGCVKNKVRKVQYRRNAKS